MTLNLKIRIWPSWTCGELGGGRGVGELAWGRGAGIRPLPREAMANIFDSIPFLASLGWPKEIYNMMPFIASMIILAFTSKKSRAPKAEGIPYDKGSR